MAHARSQSQSFQYRYRPNAPVRAATDFPHTNVHNSGYQTPPSGFPASQPMNVPAFTSQTEFPLGQSYLQDSCEAGLPHSTAFYGQLDDNTLAFQASLQPLDYPALASPQQSPWFSSDSSVASDTCSGSWSSPASSMGFSPEPQYQVQYVENSSWPPQHNNPYLTANCISMQEAFPAFAMDPEFVPNSMCYPQVAQQWHTQPIGEGLLPPYETTEFSSSHSTPERVPEQISGSSETVATIKRRSSSLMTDASTVSSSGSSVKGTVSPTSQRTKSQYEGQLLEFSTPVAQAKSKGLKSAALPCPLAGYGCTSSFISKNEWKRHINTQHLRLEAWLCDQCPKRDNKREFNRKDLFIQHLKRMHPPPCATHAPKTQLAKSKSNRSSSKSEKAAKPSKGEDLDPALLGAEQRCHLVLRQPPSDSGCLFCPTNFSGRGSWEARIEHVAKHMEQFKKEGNEVPDPKVWRVDRALEQWLVSEGVISKVRQRWSVA